MIRLLSNTPIYRRLFIAFAFAALISGVVIVLLGNFYISSLTTRGQAVRTSFDAQSLASQEEANLQRMNAVLEAFHDQIFGSASGFIQDTSFASSGPLLDLEVAVREAQFDQALKTYQSNYEIATSPNMSTIRSILLSDNPAAGNSIINSQQAALNNVINNLWPRYKSAQDAELRDLENLETQLLNASGPTPSQINQLYEKDYETAFQAREIFTLLSNNWQSVVNATVDMGKAVITVGPSQTQPIFVATLIAIVLSLLALITTGWLINITITQPLRQLATLTRRIAKGETSARAPLIGRDEIYMVAASMNNMLDNIVRLIQETQAQRDALQAQVEKLVSEVSGVGEGDLRVQAEVTADALGVLADSFNYMVEELSNLIIRVKMVAQEVESFTAIIFDRLRQLVETGDIQLSRIENAAIEVEHMADSSRKVAERAQVLFNVAHEARQNAQAGREAVQQTVEGMQHIHENVQSTASKVQTLGERSREINNIVEVISSIAHQTNRLALDAAIQAAMAGENGKGFGAVAADIRRLAERAKEQASSIARIVRGVREDIGAVAVSMQDTERETSVGSRLTQEAGIALESIFAAVEHQALEIEDINRMVRQQLESSSAIVQIMQGLSESTQQNTMSTRETSQYMERLARLVEQLRASVEAFKVREDQNYLAPGSNFSVIPVEAPQERMSLSGAFRTVTANALPSYNSVPNALPPARSAYNSSYPPAPVTPHQPLPPAQSGNGGRGRAAAMPPYQQRYGAQPHNQYGYGQYGPPANGQPNNGNYP